MVDFDTSLSRTEKSTLLNETRFERGGRGGVPCCDSKAQVESLLAEKEKLRFRVQELEVQV